MHLTSFRLLITLDEDNRLADGVEVKTTSKHDRVGQNDQELGEF